MVEHERLNSYGQPSFRMDANGSHLSSAIRGMAAVAARITLSIEMSESLRWKAGSCAGAIDGAIVHEVRAVGYNRLRSPTYALTGTHPSGV